MLFLTFNNNNIQFAKKELTWRTYITKEVLPSTRRVELINQKEFAKVGLGKNIEIFVVHVSSLRSGMSIYLAKKAQMAFLLAEKVPILAKYSDFANLFLEELTNILPKKTRVNKNAIE